MAERKSAHYYPENAVGPRRPACTASDERKAKVEVTGARNPAEESSSASSPRGPGAVVYFIVLWHKVSRLGRCELHCALAP